MVEMQTNSQDIDAMQAFLSIAGEFKEGTFDVPTDLNKDADLLQWWKEHSKDLSCWSAAAEKILLV